MYPMYPCPFVYPFSPYDIQGKTLKICEPIQSYETMGPNEHVEHNTDVKKNGKKLLKKLGSTARKVKNLMICSSEEEVTYEGLHKEKSGEKEPKSDSVPEFPDRLVVNKWFMIDCEPLYSYLSTTYSDTRVQSTEIESLIKAKNSVSTNSSNYSAVFSLTTP